MCKVRKSGINRNSAIFFRFIPEISVNLMFIVHDVKKNKKLLACAFHFSMSTFKFYMSKVTS